MVEKKMGFVKASRLKVVLGLLIMKTIVGPPPVRTDYRTLFTILVDDWKKGSSNTVGDGTKESSTCNVTITSLVNPSSIVNVLVSSWTSSWG
jgi:hypothetical protein